MSGKRIGSHVKQQAFLLCRGCDQYVSWPPGTLTEDREWEIRTCPQGCGTQIRTEARFWTTPGEATEWIKG
ncbi:hypothetical protein ACTD5D_40995 [Nocardia takedensis]|uniref:hypothetical protein n=1 Tax=Nocardia takedensis TaxID=259390 RepID=UPI003F75D686